MLPAAGADQPGRGGQGVAVLVTRGARRGVTRVACRLLPPEDDAARDVVLNRPGSPPGPRRLESLKVTIASCRSGIHLP